METIEERAKEYAAKKANISSCAIYIMMPLPVFIWKDI